MYGRNCASMLHFGLSLLMYVESRMNMGIDIRFKDKTAVWFFCHLSLAVPALYTLIGTTRVRVYRHTAIFNFLSGKKLPEKTAARFEQSSSLCLGKSVVLYCATQLPGLLTTALYEKFDASKMEMCIFEKISENISLYAPLNLVFQGKSRVQFNWWPSQRVIIKHSSSEIFWILLSRQLILCSIKGNVKCQLPVFELHAE